MKIRHGCDTNNRSIEARELLSKEPTKGITLRVILSSNFSKKGLSVD